MTIAMDDYFVDDAYDPMPAPTINGDEQEILAKLRGQLRLKLRTNRLKEAYYEAKHKVQQFEISIPPEYRDVAVAVGWAGEVIDVLEERINLRRWVSTSGDLMGLDEIFTDNYLDVEASLAHIDALIFGVSYVTVGKGDPDNDEPEILVTAESSLRSTMLWDYRARRAAAGYTQTYDERNKLIMETLYLPDSTITFERNLMNGEMSVTDRDDHGMNRVPMIRLVSRDRASDRNGRSELTPAIRYYTDAAVRTALGMEINREFYTTPQAFALSVRPEDFGVKEGMTEAAKRALGWRIMMGHINLVPPPQNVGDPPPDVKQFAPAPPTPYIQQLEAYAQLISGESKVPLYYLGYPANMPPSADSARQLEYPLVRKAERRIASYRHGWRDLARLCLLWRDRTIDLDKFRAIDTDFADPATPTRSAQADETQKLVAAEVLSPRGKVTQDRMGFSPIEQDQISQDWDAEDQRQQKLAEDAMKRQQQLQPPGSGGPGQPNRDGGTPGGVADPRRAQRGAQAAQGAGQGGVPREQS